MSEFKNKRRWAAATVVLAGTLAIGGWGIATWMPPSHAQEGKSASPADTPQDVNSPSRVSAPVRVTSPVAGKMERVTIQPGSVEAFESVELYAKVPGFLKEQKVDIGDKVKRGDLLATVDVPELEAQHRRAVAGVKQSESKVDTMKARIRSAKADVSAANATVTQAEAAAKSASAWTRFRNLQLKRMEALFNSRSIEEKLVDEAKERYEASLETERSAVETITASRAKVEAAEAKVEQTSAELKEAEADVDVVKAEQEKIDVQLAFSKVTAPFDGVITRRNFFEGAYIRSANDGGNMPLFTVQRTDKMRVIVRVPDRDVPFTIPGNDAILQIDALPTRQFKGKVSRIASHEDPTTRLMHVEIDLMNPTGEISAGMYGQVTISLDKSTAGLSIPLTCLVDRADTKAAVFVVRDGHAKRTQVRLGSDNGLRVEVVSGVTAADQVILSPSSVTDNQAVTVSAPTTASK